METRTRFEEALDSLVAKLKKDRTILAAILFGSMAYDEVWDKSDIDLYLISIDDRTAPKGNFCLLEDGVNIHACVLPRSELKSLVEGDLQGGFFHSTFSRSRILYSTDDSISELYRNIHHVGERDRSFQLMGAANGLLATLTKAEKWLHIKQDLEYSFVWTLSCVTSLAKMEVIFAGEVPGREVVQAALRHNPELFRAVYTDLIHGAKTAETLGAAINRINTYLDERLDLLFQPVLDFLAEAGGPRSTTELDAHFHQQGASSLWGVYEWLADRGVIEKVPLPVRLGEKSRAAMDEAAYYYEGEGAR